ncbi:MAG: hypothetical protein KAT00_14740, partial [Planctomycetes bacterium]|nr:hypothetical protein [Planctomycetota bacterium]
LTLRTWNGETQNELDKVITYRDLVQDTSIAQKFNQALYEGTTGGLNTSSGDLTIPPQLYDLVVAQGPTKNVLVWEGVGSGSYAYTEIWRNTSDDLGNAVLNSTTEPSLYADDVGEIAVEYFYWVRGVSTGGTPGPFNATAGTAQTVSAVDTAHIANAAIVEAKIGTAAISAAKIKVAAIETAHIKDANVSTLKLAGQAVTIPVSVHTAGLISDLSMDVGDFFIIQSLAITSTGAPVQILFSGRAVLSITAGHEASAGIRIKRGTTVVYETGVIYTVLNPTTQDYLPIALAFSDTPGVGTFTYHVEIFIYASTISGVLALANNRSQLLLETKK